MKALSLLYSAFLILFCLQTTFLILSTAHEVDVSFLVINILSVIIFITTSYFLYKFYFLKTKQSILLVLFFFVILIFGYYTYDILSKGDTKSIFAYQPLVGLLFGLLFLINIACRGKNKMAKK